MQQQLIRCRQPRRRWSPQELLPSHLRAAVGKAERRVLQKSARAWQAARGGGGGESGAAAEGPQLGDAALQVRDPCLHWVKSDA